MITTLPPVQTRAALRMLGWPQTVPLAHAVRAFQSALPAPRLAIDGIVGPQTSAALQSAVARHERGEPTASAHFSLTEFACHCAGRYGCDVIWIRRELITRLEALRAAHYPAGLNIISGCRCPQQNFHAGGKPESLHLAGQAADIPPAVTVDQARQLGFTGIGYSPEAHHEHELVVHVDVRPVPVPPFPDGP